VADDLTTLTAGRADHRDRSSRRGNHRRSPP
jgi:hypothetical protein